MYCTWEHIAGMGICMQKDSLLWQPLLLHTHMYNSMHYNTRADKQGMVVRPQAWQNVGRCRDGENVFKVSAC